MHAVDWDGDGDLDLLVGVIGGEVYLVPNEGTAKVYAFGEKKAMEADGKPLRVEDDAGPHAVDWDSDGLLDLLVGAGDGSVTFFRNIGTAKSPKLTAGQRLVAPGESAFGPKAPKKPQRGIRSKVWAADWNGDGRLDLLLGDLATQATDFPEPTPQQKAKYEALPQGLEQGRGALSRTGRGKLFGPNRPKFKEECDTFEEEFQATTKKMREIESQLPPESENHGWIWLFLRKPAAAGDRKS